MARLFTRASSHYLDNGAAVVVTEPFTIAGWVKPSATTSNQAIFSLGSSSANQRHLFYTGSSLSLHMFSGNGATTGQAGLGFGTTLTNGAWNHVCGVVSATNSRAVYLNNGGSSNTNTTNVTGITPNRTHVGAYYTNGALQAGFYQDGALAEFGLWNIALSSEERQALADGMSPLLVRPDALVGYWPLMGRTSPEIDRLGGYPLTVTGAAQADHPPIRYPGRVHVVVPGAAGANSGSGTVSGTGALEGVGYNLHYGDGDVTATGTLAGTGYNLHYGNGSVSGTGTFAGEGAAPAATAEGAGTVSGTGAFAGTGYALSSGTGDVTGEGMFVGTGPDSAPVIVSAGVKKKDLLGFYVEPRGFRGKRTTHSLSSWKTPSHASASVSNCPQKSSRRCRTLSRCKPTSMSNSRALSSRISRLSSTMTTTTY